ncbi:MAG: serine protease [Myxococcota bacterium]
MFARFLGLSVLLGLLGVGCGSEEQAFVGQLESNVVYGTDDRLEVYNHPSSDLRSIARESVVALINSNQIERGADGIYVLFAVPLASSEGLCVGESFADQPTAANCSGVLIDDDLVLTAGHCMRTQARCDSTSFVFNYHLEGPMELAAIDDDDVYECETIALRGEAGGDVPTPDFAVVRLDRSVSGGHRPASIRPATLPLTVGEPLTMIGFGSGIPAKIESGGEVFDPRTASLDYFVANSDAFRGHSGSPVFDSANELAGHLVAGLGPDYVETNSGCFVVNTFQDTAAGELVHYLAPVVAALCDQGFGSDALCGEDACDGEPCGVKAPTTGGNLPVVTTGGSGGAGGGGSIPAASSSGCRAAPGTSFPSGWLALATLALLARIRRSAV